MRPSGRAADGIRTVTFTPDYTRHAEGSVLTEGPMDEVRKNPQVLDAYLGGGEDD